MNSQSRIISADRIPAIPRAGLATRIGAVFRAWIARTKTSLLMRYLDPSGRWEIPRDELELQ
ncbi:hypothetical protein X777_03956 [Ooceraea biroi]|uniref:Uncharacterized protein n=1 Tax=Ooceraea biroi TaxID=2015173 RepID=A0A026WJD1_OOCBI|nr:hypothetical protein X777_03956 [Ooceraea biroi]